jgi:capsid portal protein
VIDLDMAGQVQVRNEDVLARRFDKGLVPWLSEPRTLINEGMTDILSPPPSMFEADVVVDECPSLAKNIRCMVTNVAGHGYHLEPIENITEDMADLTWLAMQAEKKRIQGFLDNLSIEYTFTDLLEMLVDHLQRFGNAYWEIVRGAGGRIMGINPVEDPKRIRLCRKDGLPQLVKHRHRIGTQYDGFVTERRFRRFAMKTPAGGWRYFRQYGDTRQLNAETGKYGDYQTVPVGKRANELLHFRLPHHSSEYGVIHWISVLVDALSARVAKLCNLDVLDNSGTPPLAIVISGSSDKTLEGRIRDQLAQMKGQKIRSKVLIVQVEADEVGVNGADTVLQPTIKFEPLSQIMLKEGMFLEFQRFIDQEITSVFRLPPILLGDLEETPNKATASEAKAIAEEQVFAPARRKLDDQINRLLMDNIIPDRVERGVMYWRFALNSLSNDRSEAVLAGIKEGRESGGLTPNQANQQLQTVLPGLENLPDDPRNDIPLAYQKLASKPVDGIEGLEELDGDDAEEAKSLFGKALGVKVTKLLTYRPSYDDHDPDTCLAA